MSFKPSINNAILYADLSFQWRKEEDLTCVEKATIQCYMDDFFGKNFLNFPSEPRLGISEWLLLKYKEDTIGFVRIETFQLQKNWGQVIEKQHLIDFNPHINSVAKREHFFIAPTYRKKGLGSKLSMLSIEKAKVNAELLYVLQWIRKDCNKGVSILLKQGFKPLQTFDFYWQKDSIEKGYVCPECKKTICICSAKMWINLLT